MAAVIPFTHGQKIKMADNKALLFWYITKKKRGRASRNDNTYLLASPAPSMSMKRRRIELFQVILACLNPPRTRELWTHTRSFAWFEMVELHFNDKQWYENFRVTKGTFAFILVEVSQDITRQDTIMRRAILPKHRLALTLYYLASTAEYRTVGNLFGVSTSFVCLCIRDVCEAIRKRLRKIINFPSGDNLVKVIRGYEEKWGFPMCAGAIDGTHIRIVAPKEGPLAYVNRKGYHSIIMQAVVDCNYLFRDIVVGWPGSVHDARVLANSEVFKKANDNLLFSRIDNKKIGNQQIPPLILDDPAYPLSSWPMKPYPEKSDITKTEQVFNYRLSRTRMTVENTFGRWKGRFIRFTKRVDMEVCNVVTIVTASCILHNICESQKNEFLPEWEEDQPIGTSTVHSIHGEAMEGFSEDIRGALAQYFVSQEGAR